MTRPYADEIAANLERADQSLEAAMELAGKGYYDIAASRAYYAVFYASTAALLAEGLELSKHSGVIASIHREFVRTGKLSRVQGRDLNWLFELRSVGDYGGIAHVSGQQAGQAIQAARDFLFAVKALIPPEA